MCAGAAINMLSKLGCFITLPQLEGWKLNEKRREEACTAGGARLVCCVFKHACAVVCFKRCARLATTNLPGEAAGGALHVGGRVPIGSGRHHMLHVGSRPAGRLQTTWPAAPFHMPATPFHQSKKPGVNKENGKKTPVQKRSASSSDEQVSGRA